MSVNKYQPHVWLIPEDDANRQIANGFLLHDAVADRRIDVRAPAGGWMKVLEVFEAEYLPLLRRYSEGCAVMLIDFDDDQDRRLQCETRIPDDVKSRVFIVGSKDEPETLKVELKKTLEGIGMALAHDCLTNDIALWRHPHLIHNDVELNRLVQVVRPIVFQ